MLILLPPSEGKTAPGDGPPLDLDALSFPELTPTRRRVAEALVSLSRRPKAAREILSLGPAQADDLARNALLWEQPCAPAIEVYTGVLFEALDAPTLGRAARRRLATSVLVSSSLFGLVRPEDHVPAYRLNGAARLPRIGPIASAWRPHLPALMTDDLVIDLRSTTYVAFGAAPPGHVSVRVLTQRGDRRTVVSHGNKATKGALTRLLLEHPARRAEDIVAACRDTGWTVERRANALDIVLAD